MTTQNGRKVLCLGSDRRMRDRLAPIFSTLGYETHFEDTSSGFSPVSLSDTYVGCVFDFPDPSRKTTEFARRILSDNPTFPVLILAFDSQQKDVISLMSVGTCSYFIKDIRDLDDELIAPMICNLIERSIRREFQLQVEWQNDQRHDKATMFNSALADLIKCRELRQGDSAGFIKRVTELLGETLQTQRVSVWSVGTGTASLNCLDLWDSKTQEHTGGAILTESQCPSYFAALLSRRVLVFNDVYASSETKELAEAYLPAHNISSMLDTPIMKAGELAGVLCIEHTGLRRDWGHEEQAFCISIADLIAMVNEIHTRLRFEQQLEKANEALSDSEARYKRAAKIAGIAHWIWDETNDRMAYASSELADIYGVSVDEILTRSSSTEADLSWYHPEDRDRYHTATRDAVRNKTGYDIVARIVRDDGGIRYLHEMTEAVLDSRGNLKETVGILQDVTEPKSLELERESALQEAERANKAKSEFLAAMSHEFRTPLNAIIGFSDIIQKQLFGPVGSEKYVEYSACILDSGQHMLSLVSDVLEIATIEAGRTRFDMVNVDIGALFSICRKSVLNQARKKNIEILIDIADADIRFHADERAMRQIFLNLLDNAIKFTPEFGKVTMAANRLDGKNMFSVSDSGPGIPADKIEVVSKPFVQLESDPTRSQEGLGLGLAIVKSLIDAHGGQMKIHCPEQGGTQISMILPSVD